MRSAEARVGDPPLLRIDAGTALALSLRDLRKFVRQPSRVAGAALQTLIVWAVLGAGLGPSFHVPGAPRTEYGAYFFPGTVVLLLLFSAISSTISVIEDRHRGFLQAVMVAPASRAAVVAGKTLGGAAIAVIQALLLVALAPLAGFGVAAMNLPLLLLALVLSAVAFTALGLAVAWWIDSSQGFHAVMSVVLIPLWVLSGAMFPQPASGALSFFMRLDPMTYAVAAVRRGLDPRAPQVLFPPGYGPFLEAAALAGFAGASILAAVALCRRRLA